ncbi:MAG TPA: sulfur carrier protein ThiS [Minicystis sp.]|nr:sulfur carrier protein ThiS [Minicystis sp.]
MNLVVTVNGERREVPAGTTVRGLVELLALGSGPVAVEKNGDVVPRAEHATTGLSDGDVVEIVHFVGGG